MGHTIVDVVIIGSKGEHGLRGMLVDTGATYSVLSEEVLKDIGASRLPAKVPVELGDGRIIQADAYAAVLSLEGRQAPVIAITFEDAKPVIGVQSLESLGLKVNPVTGKLEETRPKGIAYFYAAFCVSCEERNDEAISKKEELKHG